MKSVSINKLEKYCNSLENEVMLSFQLENEVIEYRVKKRLSLEESLMFVEDVVSQSISKNDMLIIPVAKEFMLGKCILTYYANFTIPENMNRAYDLVMGSTDIINQILNVIDLHQFKMLQAAIAERLDFEKQKMLVEQKTNVEKLIKEVENISTNMSTIFDGITPNQMSEFITGMSNLSQKTDISPKELAEAFVDKVAQ